jgi:hypothetical protein
MHKNGSKKHNLELSFASVKPTQLGIFDKHILCASCDGFLGKFDDYLYDVIRGFDLCEYVKSDGVFNILDVDCDIFCKGILAILWRASMSRHPAYAGLSLGKYEQIVREILFGRRSLRDLTHLEVCVQCYWSARLGQKVKLFYTLPVKSQFGGRDGFGFGLNGFRIAAKLDEKEFDAAFQPFVINRENVFRGLAVELEQTPEFSRIADIAVAELQRQWIRKHRSSQN